MTAFPVVERQMRVAARLPSTYWIRGMVALAGVTVVLLIWLGSLSSPSGVREIGRMVFDVNSGLILGFSCLAGVFLTSDCLCSEKRDGTLGLLFLTDLSSWDVILGKLAATSAVAAYAILAIVPTL